MYYICFIYISTMTSMTTILRHFLTVLSITLVSAIALQGQMTILDDQRIEGDKLIVEIAASGSLDIVAIQASFRYNKLSLEFDKVELLAFPALTPDDFNEEKGTAVNLLWFDPDLTGKLLPSNTPLFELHFNVLNTRDTEVVMANCPNEIEVIGSDDSIVPVVGSMVRDKYCTIIKGRVFQDLDRDCRHIVDPGFGEVMIEVDGPEGMKVVQTDKDGYFEVIGIEGNYTLRPVPPAPFWAPCDDTQEVTINTITNPRSLEMFLTPAFDCSNLQVKSSVGQLRPCSEEKVVVYYRNAGTENIMSGQVKINLDSRLDLIEVLENHDFNQAGEIVINTGVLKPNEAKRVVIIVETPCGEEFEGRSFSIGATGNPNPLCLPPLPGWSGANLEVKAECQNGRAVLTTTNVGNAIMSAPLPVYILEDDELIVNENIQLNIGEFFRMELDGSGATYTMLTRQVAGFPLQGPISASVENCAQSASPSLGFTNQFQGNTPTNSIDRIQTALETKASPSSLAKWSSVNGYGPEKEIQYQTNMDFFLTVPGPGEGVSKVLLVDTLSEAFDLRTFRFINSSHDVNISFEDDNVILFEVDLNGGTMYADEFMFFHFTIGFDQTLELPHSSMNRAFLFRKNAPVRQTSAFLFKVVEDYMDFPSSLAEGGEWQRYSELKIFPNPASNYLTFIWTDLKDNMVKVNIMDQHGRLINQQEVNVINGSSQLDISSLPEGIYHLQLIAQNAQIINSGSFIKLSE